MGNENVRKVCVSGAGFLGSCIANLFSREFELSILDKGTYAFDINRILPKLHHRIINCDIADNLQLQKAFEILYTNKLVPDLIIHTAAETHVDRSNDDARKFITTNILGTYNIMEFAKACEAKVILFSTDEVYGVTVEGSFLEDDPPDPRNPYSATKVGQELIANIYGKLNSVPLTIVRPSNCYGPTQNIEKFIPHSILNPVIEVYGEGRQIREWTFFEDLARAIRILVEAPYGIYNVGSGEEYTNLEVARMIHKLTGKPMRFVHDRPMHDFRYHLDSSKMRSLGWSPSVSFAEGLSLTVESFLRS